jgi:hypothetical protein
MYWTFWKKVKVFLRGVAKKALGRRRDSLDPTLLPQVAERKMNEIAENIMATGVVRNTSIPYHPFFNPRLKVDKHQAEVIAYNIAKAKNFKVGKRPR